MWRSFDQTRAVVFIKQVQQAKVAVSCHLWQRVSLSSLCVHLRGDRTNNRRMIMYSTRESVFCSTKCKHSTEGISENHKEGCSGEKSMT